METLGAGDPQRIGAYRLLARLGAGGMGQVYLARSDRGRTVAVKLVRRELAQQEEFRARFRQEVRAARRVGGHWTAPVLDADTEAEVPWVATGYVAGPSLQRVVGHDHGALPERSVRVLAAGLAGALQDIHAAGLVHRDLKPSNVLVTIDGPRVIDFGIARALETVTDGGLTRTGALVGSPGFMAPEQVRGDRVTPACDVFCLGSVLAYAATGALPFGGADSGVHALMYRIAEDEPDLSALPEGIADLVRDCLRKDPVARPSLEAIIQRTGAEDTVADGRFRDPWLPSALVAQLGRHAVRLLDTESPEDGEAAAAAGAARAGAGADEVTPEGPAASGAASDGAAVGVGAEASGNAPDLVKKPSATGPGPAASAPSAAPSAPAGTPATGPSGTAVAPAPPAVPPAPSHSPVEATPPPPGQPGGTGGGRPVNHLPTMVPGHTPPPGQAPSGHTPPPGHTPPGHTPPPGPPPAYGHPREHGYPQQYGGWAGPPGAAAQQHPYAGLGSTPPYGPPPYAPPRRGGGRATAALIAVAVVVALGAGGSVYALMRGGDDKAGPPPSPTVTASATDDADGSDGSGDSDGSNGSGPDPATSSPDSPSPTDGVIPSGYLGTWTGNVENQYGPNPRRLTITQGGVGDTVLTLVADGTNQDGDAYHCVFEARLTQEPDGSGPLEIGPSTVTVGRDSTSCSPGAATEVTLLPDGSLRRDNLSTGDELTYTKG
ncbi:serine/threonine-protein kinase [Streptomyces sennicomposti]|uniref:serine/threonine-protein kinase n=1 Tax=Streptomyces sennicomposti TaxID=2873384 RepID=UPI001CA629AE|nr:serine/threonine-protein kinase [Streptomyces sennicomposti]MBY8868453.1 serine/threonine protein kinase [Streptomyces sennicomposti]